MHYITIQFVSNMRAVKWNGIGVMFSKFSTEHVTCDLRPLNELGLQLSIVRGVPGGS